jgi:drug/metabolite transporter (DMT)-like permease
MNGLLFILVSIFWGCSFIAIRFAVEVVPPFMSAGLRIFLGAGLLALLGIVQRVPFPKSNNVRKQLLFLGLFNFGIPWACLFWGELHVQPAIASILNATVPFHIFLLSWMFLPEEKPTRLQFFGVGLGFLGILLVVGPSITTFSTDKMSVYGMIAILVMSAAYAVGSVWTKKLTSAADVRWNVALQGVSATISLWVLSFLFESQSWVSEVWKNPKAIVSLLYLSIFSTALGWLIFFRLLRAWGPLRASGTTYIVPCVAVLIDWLYFQRLPTEFQMIGAALIISAVGVMNFSRFKRMPFVARKAA